MLKRQLFEFLLGLVVIILVVFFYFSFYFFKTEDKEITGVYYASFITDVVGFQQIDKLVNNDKAYFLYKNNDFYLLKIIDIELQNNQTFSKTLNGTCSLYNSFDEVYVHCFDDKQTFFYDSHLNYIKENISNIDFNNVLDFYCLNDCYYIKYDYDNLQLYRENELIDNYIKSYKKVDNGYLIINNNKIKYYDLKQDKYYEFVNPINNNNNNVIAFDDNYNLYLLEDNLIYVYNLVNSNMVNKINVENIEDNILDMILKNGNLYIFTLNKMYVVNLFYGNNVEDNCTLESLINEYNIKYNVDISYDGEIFFNEKYRVYLEKDIDKITQTLDYLNIYFLKMGSHFFEKFKDKSMNGIEIFLVNSIYTNDNNKNVAGLYTRKNNKYYLVISIDNEDAVLSILFHETMHAIEDYLKNYNLVFADWNDLNYEGFYYNNIYYTNKSFNDTLEDFKYNEDVYFVDNYARSNELEDRARLFEKICLNYNLEKYVNLNKKVIYLKKIILQKFPELDALFNN